MKHVSNYPFKGDAPAIRFRDLELEADRVSVEFEIGDRKGSQTLYFGLNEAIKIHPDQIAVALSTFCVRRFSLIDFAFPVSERTGAAIANYTGSQVTSEAGTEWVRKSRRAVALNFSGGFDSLAAKQLLPAGAQLVSMDFGGRFARERSFFEQFSPLIVSTNLVDLGLHRGQWAFMGIGAILAADELAIDQNVFGSILEAGVDNFREAPLLANGGTFPSFSLSGFTNKPYASGLTEIGTLLVIGHYAPELIRESLDSCANDNEEKRYRKQILAQIVENRLGSSFNLRYIQDPEAPFFSFGSNFALDFLSFYIAKHSGIGSLKLLLKSIPDEIEVLSKKLSLSFYEKFNSKFLQPFDEVEKNFLKGRLCEADVGFYNDKDWDEFNTIRDFLSKTYPI